MKVKREFFPKVRKTIIPRPIVIKETDVLSQTGSAKATDAVIYGPNWYHDKKEDLIEIYDAGPALSFRHILPRKDKYEREGLLDKITEKFPEEFAEEPLPAPPLDKSLHNIEEAVTDFTIEKEEAPQTPPRYYHLRLDS